MRQYGIGTYRFALSMRTIDRRDNGLYNWSQIDRLAKGAAQNGIRLQPILFRAAQRLPDPPLSPSELRDWSKFVAAAVHRYGNDGQFWLLNPLLPKLPVAAWQVWNEPNLRYFWDDQPNSAAYANLLADSAATIRANDPDAIVVLAGLSNAATKRMSPSRFIGRLYRAGSASDFDVAAIHAYARNSVGSLRATVALYARMARNEDPATPVWVTEIGWSTAAPADHYLGTNPLGQARRLRNSFAFLRGLRSTIPVSEILWYSWQDAPGQEACGWCAGSGLIRTNGLAKPAAEQFALASALQPR